MVQLDSPGAGVLPALLVVGAVYSDVSGLILHFANSTQLPPVAFEGKLMGRQVSVARPGDHLRVSGVAKTVDISPSGGLDLEEC